MLNWVPHNSQQPCIFINQFDLKLTSPHSIATWSIPTGHTLSQPKSS